MKMELQYIKICGKQIKQYNCFILEKKIAEVS